MGLDFADRTKMIKNYMITVLNLMQEKILILCIFKSFGVFTKLYGNNAFIIMQAKLVRKFYQKICL